MSLAYHFVPQPLSPSAVATSNGGDGGKSSTATQRGLLLQEGFTPDVSAFVGGSLKLRIDLGKVLLRIRMRIPDGYYVPRTKPLGTLRPLQKGYDDEG